MANCVQCGEQLPAFTFGEASKFCKNCRTTAPKLKSKRRYEDELEPVALPLPRVLNATNCLIAVSVAVWVIMVASGISAIDPSGTDLLPWGADFGPQTLGGQYWRVITAAFLHFGILHLAMNMWCLWVLGRLTEKLVGRFATFAIYLITAVGASILSLSWDPMRVSAGASGAIFGLTGVLIPILYYGKLNLAQESKRRLLGYVVKFAGLNLLYGLKAHIDNMAHLGGLVTGLAIGFFLARGWSLSLEDRMLQSRKVLINSALIIVLVFVPVARAKSWAPELMRAEDAVDQKNFNEALSHLKRYTSSRPDDAYGHAMLGYTLEQLQRNEEAAAEYERTLAIEPDFAAVQVSLADLYVQKHKLKEAVPLYRKGLPQTKDADAHSYFNYAEALKETGSLQEAESALQHCLGMDDNNIQAHELLAEVLLAEGKSELAVHETKYVMTLTKKNQKPK